MKHSDSSCLRLRRPAGGGAVLGRCARLPVAGPPQPTAAWGAWLADHGIPEEHWDDASTIIDSDGNGARIYFPRVPELKAVKNRLHLDVNAGGPPGTPPSDRRARVDQTVERLTTSGATFVAANTQHGEYCVTMLDPEGNEFDVQRAPDRCSQACTVRPAARCRQ